MQVEITQEEAMGLLNLLSKAQLPVGADNVPLMLALSGVQAKLIDAVKVEHSNGTQAP